MSIRRQGKIGDFASVVKCITMSKMIGRIVQTDSYLHHNLLLGKFMEFELSNKLLMLYILKLRKAVKTA